jgi:hypothetical protein
LGFTTLGLCGGWKARAAWEEVTDASKPASVLARVPGYFFSESESGGRRRQGPADHGAGGEAARRLREERGAPDVPGCSKQPPRVPPVAAAAGAAAGTASKSIARAPLAVCMRSIDSVDDFPARAHVYINIIIGYPY